MIYFPQVGDRVQLSEHGYDNLKLNKEGYRQAQNMVVTSVDDINQGTGWEPIYVIEVDQPLINVFLLDSTMVELIP